MAIGIQQRIKGAAQRGLLLLMLILSIAFAQASGPGSMFSIIGHSYQGEYLVIEYEIRYPGLTKVKMFDDAENLLWRNQYVDDEEGKHRIVLRASKMQPGNYRFEFDFKNQFNSYIVQR